MSIILKVKPKSNFVFLPYYCKVVSGEDDQGITVNKEDLNVWKSGCRTFPRCGIQCYGISIKEQDIEVIACL